MATFVSQKLVLSCIVMPFKKHYLLSTLKKRHWQKNSKQKRLSHKAFIPMFSSTIRRPKSAPYLRLKHSKSTSKCQNFLQYPKTQKLDRIGALKGGFFGIFQHPFCRKTSKKLKGGRLVNKKIEKSLSAEKSGRGTYNFRKRGFQI